MQIQGKMNAANLQSRLRRVLQGTSATVGKGLAQSATRIAEESKARTPVQSGALRDSTRVSGPEVTPTGARVRVAVGGASQAYAVQVHEDMSAVHPVGGAKFLERAAAEKAGDVPRQVGKAVSDLVGGR